MSSGWLSRNWYLSRMSYDNVIMSSGWHTLPFLSHPDEITIFDFPHFAVAQSPHRISAGDSLLFMRCVSLTLTRLVSAWWQEEAPSTILAKPLSDCVTVFWLRQCKWRHLNVCGILKKMTCYSQTNWISCILNLGVRCDVVSDAGHTLFKISTVSVSLEANHHSIITHLITLDKKTLK